MAKVDLSQYGARFIPLVPNGKVPKTKYKNVTFSKAQLKRYLKEGCNLGLLAQPRFIFLDVDTKQAHGEDGIGHFVDWLRENQIDPQTVNNTLTQQTSSGGFHFIFLQPRDMPFKQDIGFLPGVDVKASANNYIVVSPSKVNGKSYRFINPGAKVLPLPPKLFRALAEKAKAEGKASYIDVDMTGFPMPATEMHGDNRYVIRGKRRRLDLFYTLENGFGTTDPVKTARNFAAGLRYATTPDLGKQFLEEANDASDEPLDAKELDIILNQAYASSGTGGREREVNDTKMVKLDNHIFVSAPLRQAVGSKDVGAYPNSALYCDDGMIKLVYPGARFLQEYRPENDIAAYRELGLEPLNEKPVEIPTKMDGAMRYLTHDKYETLDVFYTVENGFGPEGQRNDNIFAFGRQMRKMTTVDETIEFARRANENSEVPYKDESLVSTIRSAYAYLLVPQARTRRVNGYDLVVLDHHAYVALEAFRQYQSYACEDYPPELVYFDDRVAISDMIMFPQARKLNEYDHDRDLAVLKEIAKQENDD